MKSGCIHIPQKWRQPVLHSAYLELVFQEQDAAPKHAQDLSLQEPRLLNYLEVLTLLTAAGLTPSPSRGFQFGISLPLSAHGLMGQAAIASPTIRDAMLAIAKYTDIRNACYDIPHEETDCYGSLSFQPRFDMEYYKDFVTAGTIFTFVRLFLFLLGRDNMKYVTLHHPWPDLNASEISEQTAIPAKNIMQQHSVVPSIQFEKDILAHLNLTRNAQQYRLACLGADEALAQHHHGFTAQVKSLLDGCENAHWYTLDEIGEHLNVTKRTLIRRLSSEGTSYSAILDETRQTIAAWYLRNSTLSVSDIAYRLGFKDDSNFSRSFRKWMGATPSAFRNDIK